MITLDQLEAILEGRVQRPWNTFPWRLVPVTKECGPACVFILKPCPGAKRYPRRVECLTHGYIQTPYSGLGVDKARIESPEIRRMLEDWQEKLLPWVLSALEAPDPHWHFAYNLPTSLRPEAAVSRLPVEEIINDGRIQMPLPSLGWRWDEVAQGLFREDIFWNSLTGRLEWKANRRPAFERLPFYCRAKSDPLVDLPLRVEVPDRELKTGTHNHYCPYPRPASFCDLHLYRAARPVLMACDGNYRREFNQTAADKASERFYNSLPLRIISCGTFSTNSKNLDAWITQGHTDNDPNLDCPKRYFRNIIQPSGSFIQQSTTAAVRWNYAHDKMLEEAGRDAGVDHSASEVEIKARRSELERTIDTDGPAAIKKLRDDYAASRKECLDFSTAREVDTCEANMPPLRRFKGVVGSPTLNLILPSALEENVTEATMFLCEANLKIALKEDGDKQRADALDKLRDIVAEAIGVDKDEIAKKKWQEFYNEIVRPKNSRKRLEDLKKVLPLPGSADEVWLEHLRRYVGVLIPKKACTRPEIISNKSYEGIPEGASMLRIIRLPQNKTTLRSTKKGRRPRSHKYSVTMTSLLNRLRATTLSTFIAKPQR